MLNTEEMSQLLGHLETIKSEAEEMPQTGGNEATIIEQADGGIEILKREMQQDRQASPNQLRLEYREVYLLYQIIRDRITEATRDGVEAEHESSIFRKNLLDKLTASLARGDYAFDHAPKLLAACLPVLKEAKERADYMHDTWNPDAHVELTLTIAELRAIRVAVEKAEGKQ